MASHNQLITITHLLVFLSCISSTLSQASFRPKALILPVIKDLSTGQYITEIKQRTPPVTVKLTVDLGGQFLWVDCEKGFASSSYRPARCNSAQCNLAGSKSCGGDNICGLFPDNTIKSLGSYGELGDDVVSLQSTDGSNPGRFVVASSFLFSCAPTLLLDDLAGGVSGMVGLGKGNIGVPNLLSKAFSMKRKFALCLSSSKGVVFFGDGPYNLLTSNDLSQGLIYTPLLTNPVSTAGGHFEGERSVEYFIGVKGIRVNGASVAVNTTLLNIDSKGFGGTKISTVQRYTMLESSIYRAVVDAFVKAVGKVPRAGAVAPFSLCYDAKGFTSTRLGLGVPTVEFVLQSQTVSWMIFGANSMVDVGNNVVCFGFLDAGVLGELAVGGGQTRTSIVIGGYQIEDNLLQFDLASSRLGFSSLLYGQRTTCANFNFTSIG